MGNIIKIALADDHNLFRKGVEELIDGFDKMKVIFSATNGQELIDKLATTDELPDVCLLDINMPKLNGFETAKKIKAGWPDIKILAVSVYDSEFNIIGMLRAGAGGYVLKDAQPDALRKAIEGIYKNGFYHSELVTGRIIHQLISQPEEVHATQLNEKEITFLKHSCTEMTYREIAEQMGVSHRTIDGYRDQLFAKLEIKSRIGLAMYAVRTGIAIVND